jgi:DNA topoisomerase-1
MELIVAEKPKVAHTIAKALGGSSAKQKGKGAVSYYECEVGGKKVVVAPAVGHLFNLAEKKRSRDYPVFNIEWKPSYSISKASAFTKAYVELLNSLGKKANMCTIACDYDIEGSVIGYNVYRFCYGKKPGKRMKFSSLVPEELKEAYENASDGLDLNNAHAGEARHMLDWYYGINLSRALMNALRKAGGFRTMSIGRVQGPALSILSKKEKAIREFVPEDYWEVKIWVKGTEFMHEKERFMDEGEAKKAHSAIGKEAEIKSVEKKERKIWPYPPFDLTSLQVEAHRCFGISPSQTLSLAQSLYENSLISYPRTSSQKLPAKLGLKKIILKLADNPRYKEKAQKLMEKGWGSKPFEGKKSDPAHPAIHPTGLQKPLEGREKKLYDLIVCRFLSVFAPPAKAQGTKVEAESGGEAFKCSGEMIGERNWIDFYPYYKGKERELPSFSEGEKGEVEKKGRVKKQTKAPPRYTPASIISELEKNRLGTKATRSTIVDTLFKRDYVSGKSITVTDFGMKVWNVLGKYSPKILDPELTRKIEEDMDRIVEGKTTEDKVVEEGKKVLVNILDDFKKHESGIGKELLSAMRETEEKENDMGPCPKCKKNNLKVIRLRKGNQFIGCGGYPECRNIYPLPHGAYVTRLKKDCPVCGMASVRVRRGKMGFDMCIDPKCKSKESWGKKGGKKGEAHETKEEGMKKGEAAKADEGKGEEGGEAGRKAKEAERRGEGKEKGGDAKGESSGKDSNK